VIRVNHISLLSIENWLNLLLWLVLLTLILCFLLRWLLLFLLCWIWILWFFLFIFWLIGIGIFLNFLWGCFIFVVNGLGGNFDFCNLFFNNLILFWLFNYFINFLLVRLCHECCHHVVSSWWLLFYILLFFLFLLDLLLFGFFFIFCFLYYQAHLHIAKDIWRFVFSWHFLDSYCLLNNLLNSLLL